MLDRGDAGARRIAKHRTERGLGYVRPLGLKQPLAPARQARTQEDHARVDVRRMENELRRRRRVNSDSGHLGPVAEGLLKAWLHRQLTPGARPALIGDAERFGAGSPWSDAKQCRLCREPFADILPLRRPDWTATLGAIQRRDKSPLVNKNYKLAAILFVLYLSILKKIS